MNEQPTDVSVIVPVFNEAECVGGVLAELAEVLQRDLPATFEIIVVDDGSSDDTPMIALACAAKFPGIFRIIRHARNVGQSFAFHTGFRAARGGVVVTIDGDGQNVPDDIPRVVATLKEKNCACCCGYRAQRKDTFWKRFGSRLANGVRNHVLEEDIIDTGCSVKAFRREFVLGMQPWNGMHRFFASLVMMQGGAVEQIEVSHRPRAAGTSKYTNWSRLKKTVADLRAVKWLKSRSKVYEVENISTAVESSREQSNAVETKNG